MSGVRVGRGATPRVWPRATVPVWRDEAGSTLSLIACFAALAATLTLVIAAASSLYLERKRLFTVADGAALAAAEAWSFSAAPARAGSLAVTFDDSTLRRAVDEYLAAAGATAAFEDLRLVRVASADGRGVAVELAATWRWLGIDGIVPVTVPIAVTATARSIIR